MRKLAVTAILGLALLLLLSSAVPAKATHGDSSGLYGGNLRVAVRGPISLNPFTATDADSWKVIPLVYDSLVRIDRATLTPTSWAATSWTLTANAAHFRPPYLETVTFSVYSSTTSAATALLSGNLDFIGWSLLVDEPSQIINIGGVNRTLLSDATIVQNPGFRQLSFGFNMDSSRATSDAGLRSALAVTLNPILYRQLYPSTIISHSPVIQEDVPWYNPAVPTYQVTITPVGTPPRSTALLTQSLQLLDNAGYVDRDGDGFRERPNGAPLALTVVGIPVAEDTRIFAIQFATVDIFTRLGIHASLVSVPSATILTTLAAGNYDPFAATLDTSLDPGFPWDYVHSSR